MKNELYDLVKTHHRIALVGAGGKTTTLLYLGSSLANAGKSVLCYTTTHMEKLTDYVCPEGMVLDTTPNNLEAGREFDYYIYEADGSKGHPIKTPNETEPVFVPDTDLVLVLMGMSAIGQPLSECCHRYERLLVPEKTQKIAELYNTRGSVMSTQEGTGEKIALTATTKVNERLAACILTDGYGHLVGLSEDAEVFYILNQADDESRLQSAAQVAAELRRLNGRDCAFTISYPEEARNRRE